MKKIKVLITLPVCVIWLWIGFFASIGRDGMYNKILEKWEETYLD